MKAAHLAPGQTGDATKSLLLTLVLLAAKGFLSGARAGKACDIATGPAAMGDSGVAYARAGQGRPVLLLHGLFAQKEQWHDMLCALAGAGYTAVAPDLPGYGQSVGFPVEDYALERQVLLLHQFVGVLGFTAYDLAGSSMGGAIAWLHGAAALKRRVPRSRLAKLADAGHLLLMENTDTVASIYLRFLKGRRN